MHSIFETNLRDWSGVGKSRRVDRLSNQQGSSAEMVKPSSSANPSRRVLWVPAVLLLFALALALDPLPCWIRLVLGLYDLGVQ